MTIRLQRRVLAVTATALLFVGCSARNEVSTSNPDRANNAVHARAAQRIELPGAVEGAAPGPLAGATTQRRVLPEAPEVIRLPDGTVGIKVAAQYFDTIVACRQPDGSFGTNCPPAPGSAPRSALKSAPEPRP